MIVSGYQSLTYHDWKYLIVLHITIRRAMILRGSFCKKQIFLFANSQSGNGKTQIMSFVNLWYQNNTEKIQLSEFMRHIDKTY